MSDGDKAAWRAYAKRTGPRPKLKGEQQERTSRSSRGDGGREGRRSGGHPYSRSSAGNYNDQEETVGTAANSNQEEDDDDWF